MIKEQIINTAFDLFSQYGIKSVSMDDVAKAAGISKRTLYESFEDKETLLIEGIDHNSESLGQYLTGLEKEPFNALEVILLFYEEMMKNGSPDKPGGLSIQLCKSEKKEFYIRYSS